MKIDYCSDLHLEWGGVTLPGGDVLVLAGDICEVRSLRKNFHSTRQLPHVPGAHEHRFYDFFYHECAKYDRVFYVVGNHEHYHGRFDKTHQELRSLLPANVELLDKEAVEYAGVVFMGATLWTNCNNGDSLTVWTLKSSMNDYRVIQNHYADQGLYHKLAPEFTFREHANTLEAFKPLLAKNAHKPVVMITHHAPSFMSISQQYRDDHHMNGGYASDLSEFILDHPQIKKWIHGHVHSSHQYVIGDTEILCNPRGYLGHEARADNYKVDSFSVFPEEYPIIARGSWE